MTAARAREQLERASPLDFACETCKRPVGRPCVIRGTEQTTEVHAPRRELYELRKTELRKLIAWETR